MFDNLVNIHDLVFLWNKARRGQLKRVLLKLVGTQHRKVRLAWSHTQTPPTNWWDIPAVQQRWNRLISGRDDVDYNAYIDRRYLDGRQGLRGLSLGCGTGVREARWSQLERFARINAYDLSPERIDFARRRAAEQGYDRTVRFAVGDAHTLPVQPAFYDVVLVEGALHHFSPLEPVLRRIDRFLKPEGHLIAVEYVGPNRFQWTPRQLEAINGLLAVLPRRYRLLPDGRTVKTRVHRASRLSARLSDPSEAAEAAAILPLLGKLFDLVEVKAYGGTILHMLFNSIAHNFLDDDPQTRRFLDLCFEVEDALLASGDIRSDFAVAVCRKKRAD